MLIKVYEKSDNLRSKLLFESEIDRSFRIGRQETGEEDEICLVPSQSSQSDIDLKLVIAPANEREYSRNFAEVLLDKVRVEVRNTSANLQIFVGASTPINPQESRLGNVPFEFTLGNRTICILNSEATSDSPAIVSLSTAPLPPGQHSNIHSTVSLAEVTRDHQIDGTRLLELLQTMLQIFQDSPNRQEFFVNAAQAMVHQLELDHVWIAFLPEHTPDFGITQEDCSSGWRKQALSFSGREDPEWAPSSQILQAVANDKTTVYQIPDVRTESLMSVSCLVASPLLNTENDIIGVVYGDRVVTGTNQLSFGETEAKFVELFASGISAGLARLNQERKLTEIRSRFDQFFTPELARRLESDTTLLEPRSADVTILFADIRGFSRISERIGPEKSIHWINSVLSHLTDCVFKHKGVVVDYVGDEVMAMWGAPIDQANHSELAVRAALEMIEGLPQINLRWEAIIGEPVEIGIGINSGEAQVGNTGSDRKFKYGPLGDVVNVGSRVQGATKQLKAGVLVTESTSQGLSKEILRRKLRSVRFVNVERSVTLYEIPFRPDENWTALKKEYEDGLAFYEAGKLALASQKMASVINQFVGDGPSMRLLSDSVKSLELDPADFDPVWKLGQK